MTPRKAPEAPKTKAVVMETIRPAKILADSESTQIKSKIPEYARDFEKEWLYIRGINKTLEDFIIKYNLDASELFVSSCFVSILIELSFL